MNKRFILTLATVLVLGLGGGVGILLTKGYTFSPQQRKVFGTGILSATSMPDGASVYIDGHLITATNATIPSLTPKIYTVKIVKDGFISWEKQVEIKAGLVAEIKANLFPAIPTIYPMTYNGVIRPVLSPDGTKLAFLVPTQPDNPVRQKGGIWVWTMSSQPISFARSAEPHQIATSQPGLDFSSAELKFSPDSKQLLATLKEAKTDNVFLAYLLPVDSKTSANDLRDITPTLPSTLKEWEDDIKVKEESRILSIKDPMLQKTASASASLKWSPDETKFIYTSASYQATNFKLSPSPKEYKVIDLERNKEYVLPSALEISWLPDSRHLILIQNDKIEVSDFDGSNIAEIYAGNFDKSYVFPWLDSSRLLIVSSHPTATASKPNLFGVNLK